MKIYILVLLYVLTLQKSTDRKSTEPVIIDGFIGGYSFETEEAIIDIYSDNTFTFRHWGDVHLGCGRGIKDSGSWEKIKGTGYRLTSFKRIESMDCKKRRIFRSFKLIPKDSVVEVPLRIYGYRYLHQYSKIGLESVNNKN